MRNSCVSQHKVVASSLNLADLGFGNDDDGWILHKELESEAEAWVDPILFDPDVNACDFFSRIQSLAELSGSSVQQEIDGVSRLELREVSMQGGLCPRGPIFFPGLRRSVRRLGQKRGFGLSWSSRSRQGPKPLCWMGKGKNLAMQFKMKTGIVRGDANCSSKFVLPPAPLDVISSNSILDVFEDCCSEDEQESSPVSDLKDSEEVLVPAEHPPAPYNVISAFVILDEPEDYFSGDEEDHVNGDGEGLFKTPYSNSKSYNPVVLIHRNGKETWVRRSVVVSPFKPKLVKKNVSPISTSMVQGEVAYSDDEPPLEPNHVVKVIAAKPSKWSSKTVSHVSVRRSPRLSKVVFA